jgi:hypothetical protein
MTDVRIRVAKTIARETIDILESLVTNNGTDRSGAAATAACVTLLLTGLAGRNPTTADGGAQESENGLIFATAILGLLRDDVPADLHAGDGMRPVLPSYIPQEAEGHIMYGLTRLRSAIQNWTMLPGVDGADIIQAGFAGGIRQFVKDNRTARPAVAYELVSALGRLIEPARPVVPQPAPQPVPQAARAPMDADASREVRVRAPFSFQAAARVAA